MVESCVKLLPRAYEVRGPDGTRRQVTVRDALRQYARSLNFFADRRRALHAAFECSHLLMAIPAVLFFVEYLDAATGLAYLAMFTVLANFTNTVWYHRYCSHRAFAFSSRIYPRLCLWLNPLGYREEAYALVHHVHHTRSDGDDDPNGPHLGWLGNYTASYFEVDTDITEQQFTALKARLAHLSMPFSSHASFRRWGCVEYIPHYLARWVFANLSWGIVWGLAGGMPLLMAWLAAQFSWHVVVRDFNFRGHGTPERQNQVDGRDFDRKSLALNQRIYGYLAGEWHNNHHAFRASANTAFLPGQIDVPFLLIRLMHRLGIVSGYHDHRRQFQQRFGLDADGSAPVAQQP